MKKWNSALAKVLPSGASPYVESAFWFTHAQVDEGFENTPGGYKNYGLTYWSEDGTISKYQHWKAWDSYNTAVRSDQAKHG